MPHSVVPIPSRERDARPWSAERSSEQPPAPDPSGSGGTENVLDARDGGAASPVAERQRLGGDIEPAPLGLLRSWAQAVGDDLVHGGRTGQCGDVLAGEHDAGGLERS